ncbi:MAG: glycosyltransferase [Waterburya sp.]
MRLSVCITTMNAVHALSSCLQALWQSSIKPSYVFVSDDSLALEIQQQNRHVVDQYPYTDYIVGPHKGVCANRNCALKHLPSSDFVAFIDDDICVESDFIAKAIARYKTLTPQARERTFLTGGTPTKLSFRGFFRPSKESGCVDLHTAVFPVAFFTVAQWDEKIFFGYEDALLCLEGIKNGFNILHCPELKVTDTRSGQSTLNAGGIGNLTKYDIYVEAARLYVGIQRYKNVFPNPFKLTTFLLIYFMHMTIYLYRKKAIAAWSDLIKYSHFKDFFI